MYVIREFQGKGRSVIATQQLRKGQVIIKEAPFLTAEDVYDAIYQMYCCDEEAEAGATAFECLVPHTIDKYTVQYKDICDEIATLPVYMRDAMLQMRPQRLRLLVAKFCRNAFHYTYPGAPPCALLAKGTLLNHSCDNNVDFTVNKNGDFLFTANRDIEIGEELCDSYLQTNTSKKKRLSALEFQYGFVCTCSKCIDVKNKE